MGTEMNVPLVAGGRGRRFGRVGPPVQGVFDDALGQPCLRVGEDVVNIALLHEAPLVQDGDRVAVCGRRPSRG